MLLFDIEFGKVCVTALSGWPAVTFDTIQRRYVLKRMATQAKKQHCTATVATRQHSNSSNQTTQQQ